MTGAATVRVSVNSSEDFASEGQCHLSAKGLTLDDATASSRLIFSPKHSLLPTNPTSPQLEGSGFLSRGLQDYPCTCALRSLGWRMRENRRYKREESVRKWEQRALKRKREVKQVCSWKEELTWLEELVADSYTNFRFSTCQVQNRK